MSCSGDLIPLIFFYLDGDFENILPVTGGVTGVTGSDLGDNRELLELQDTES